VYRTITAARPAPAAHDPGPPVRMSSGQPVNADDSAKTRDLLAGDRTLLAWIRTALAFAGLGFAVAKFGRTPDLIRTAGYLGIALTLAGLLITISGYVQYRTMLTKEEPPPGHTRAITMATLHGGRLLRPGVRAPRRLPRRRHLSAAGSTRRWL